jgi:hypothetical protein
MSFETPLGRSKRSREDNIKTERAKRVVIIGCGWGWFRFEAVDELWY